MDDPFFAEDDGEFDDFYGNGVKSSRPSQLAMPRPSDAHETRAPVMIKDPSLVYPDTPASSVASFVSRSTDGGMLSVSTVTTPHHGASGHDGTTQKRPKKLRRRRSQERFEVAWEKDSDVRACFVCSTEFSLLKRKHHCRHCGRVICSDCSSFRRFASSRGKHRVCSYCSVEIANGGAGRHTMGSGAASMSDIEAATPQHHDRDHHGSTKLRHSIVGMFSSKSADARTRPLVASSRKSDSYQPAAKEPSSELFDTGDDTWFGDPVDEHAGRDKPRRGKQDRPSQSQPQSSQSQAATNHKDSYARPQVTRAPDSLFDVQFTNGNHFDAESEDDDHDDFAMPKPTSQSETKTAIPQANDFRASTRGSTAGRMDAPMTMDDLQASSASASYVSSSGRYETALVVVPSITGSRSDRTFYNDDADAVVVDEAPGYYDSVVNEQSISRNTTSGYSNGAPMPRPTELAAVSEGSSGTLVEVPEMSATVVQTPAKKEDDRSPEGKSISGALKRFFGISKNKRDGQSTKQSTASSVSLETEKSASSQPAPSNMLLAERPNEQPTPVEMPRPTVIAPAELDHYEASIVHSRDIDIYDARHTSVEEVRSKDEPLRNTFDAPLRHTMAGYVMPSARAESLMRASIVGTAVQPEPMSQQVPRKTTRNSTRSRRDTFDNLFDLPAKSSKAPTVSAPPAAPIPTQSWHSPYEVPASVGVARFDRPRREDEDDPITRDLLGLSGTYNQDRGGVETRASVVQTPWSAVSNYRSTGDAPRYATPDVYASSNREARSQHNEYEAAPFKSSSPFESSSRVASEYDETSNYYENGRGSEPKRTIMEDLKPKSTSQSSPRNGTGQNASLDDYFADFEKPTEYVFDTATGTYVSSDPRRARQPVDSRTSAKSQSSPVPKRTMALREERLRAPTRSVDLLDPVHEDAPDEIDGIIADKISTLAGELEALKQLLRQRRVRGSPTSAGAGGASTASRKQSIFDSDGSDEEVIQRSTKSSKEKRKPSSKKTTGSNGAIYKNLRARKDSFADLFEDDPDETDDRHGAVPRNYEALFRLGQDTHKRADNSDDGSDDKKLSRRARTRGSKATKQQRDYDSNSESDDEARSQRHVAPPASSRFNPSTEGEDQFVSSTWGSEDINAQALAAPVETARLPHKFVVKKAKRDAIDSLFDSDSDQDMGQLYGGAAQVPTVGPLDLLGEDVMSGSNDDSGEIAKQGVKLREDASSSDHSQAIVLAVATTNLDESRHASSDEEFSSTLRNLRGRRKTPTTIAKNQLVVRPHEVLGDSEDDAHDSNSVSLAAQSDGGAFQLSMLGGSDDDVVDPFTPTREDRASQSATTELAVAEEQGSSGHHAILAEVDMKAGFNHSVAGDQEVPQLDHDETIRPRPIAVGVDSDYGSTSDAVEFDPLALLDEESEVPNAFRSERTVEASESSELPLDSAVVPTGWGEDIGAVGDRLKALRFRDSLLDDSPADALETSTSLNLDDLFGGHDKAIDNGSDEDEHQDLSSEDGESFSFEIKPKKRASEASLSTAQQRVTDVSETVKPPFSSVVEVVETVPREEQPPLTSPNDEDNESMHVDADVLGSIAEETTWDATSVTSSTGDSAQVPEVDAAQFQDDWQRMQEQEKERKKKLQLKQRQAQRDKMKKQSSSARSLGKLGSTRGFAPPPSSPTASNFKTSADQDSVDGQEHKKKKKHRKKAEEENGDHDGAESQSKRKKEKRREKRYAV